MFRDVFAEAEASWIKRKASTVRVTATRNIVLELANGEFLSEMRDSNEHYVARRTWHMTVDAGSDRTKKT